ncbi:MAG TPA: hypothetical protein VFU59_07895, partial [Candidatus Eisenbacteria bacterium]|nr:hypothetical protein [Candidatus Eisenbacteria bacterium]
MPKRLLFPVLVLLAVAAVATPALLSRGRGSGAGPERTVELRMKEYAFNGSNPTFQFKPGERIHFIVTNDESTNVLHNFRVVGMNVE